MKTGNIDQLGVIMRPGMMIRRSKKTELENKNNQIALSNNFFKSLKIVVKQLKIAANIGVYPHEKNRLQDLLIDIEVFLKSENINLTDDINKTIDYVYLSSLALKISKMQHFNLIETYGQFLANEILKDERIEKLILNITKPSAIENAHSAQIMLECAR